MSGRDGNGATSPDPEAVTGGPAALARATSEPALELRGITAAYGRSTVLRAVDLTVMPGSIVALLGPNGAGKTTLLRVASGLMAPSHGQVTLHGEDVTRRRAFQRAREGLCLVPDGRGIFPNLSVRENLLLQVPPWRADKSFDAALDAFPVLRERLGQTAHSMSGGQQQMLALSRCFLADPKVALLDEVSMGLAPRIIDEIFQALLKLAESGVSLLLVEQYVHRALEVSDRFYVLTHGSITLSGNPSDITEEELTRRYFGELSAMTSGSS